MSHFEEKTFEILMGSGAYSDDNRGTDEYTLVFDNFTCYMKVYGPELHFHIGLESLFIDYDENAPLTPQSNYYYRIVLEALKNDDDVCCTKVEDVEEDVEKDVEEDEKDNRVYAVHCGHCKRMEIMVGTKIDGDYLCEPANGYVITRERGYLQRMENYNAPCAFATKFARIRMTMAIDPDVPIEPDFAFPLK